MNKEDLEAKLEELKKELIKINAQISTGTTPKSPGRVKQIKKNIAKILTILNESSKLYPNSHKSLIRKKEKEEDKKTWVKYAQGAVYPKNYVFVKQ